MRRRLSGHCSLVATEQCILAMKYNDVIGGIPERHAYRSRYNRLLPAGDGFTIDQRL